MANVPAQAGEPGRRQEVLRLLKAAAQPMSIAAIASELGVHPNTVRFHLDVLVAAGQAEQVTPSRRRPGRPPQLFRSVRRMDPAGLRQYQLLAEILVQSIAAEPEPIAKATQAGRAWGQLMADPSGTGEHAADARPHEPVRRLVSLLTELGFDPALQGSPDHQQVGLRHCPFLELAEWRKDVVCPIHLGLMQGAMDAWDAPVIVSALQPFAEPDLCVAHLATAARP